jgi:hypothetical protein
MQDFVNANTTKISPHDSVSLNCTVRQSHFSTAGLTRMNATTVGASKPNFSNSSKKYFKPVHAASTGRPAHPRM